MKVKDRETAQAELSPIIGDLYEAFFQAYEKLHNLPFDERAEMSRRSESSLICDFTVGSAKKLLKDKVVPFTRHGQTMFRYRDYTIKFKKLTRDLRPMSIATARSEGYKRQGLACQVPLPLGKSAGIPTNLYAGYIPNATRTEPAGVFVVCPDDGDVLWHIKVEGKDRSAATAAVVFDELPRQMVRPKEATNASDERRKGTV